MTLCYLGLGSNLNTPPRQLRRALAWLHKLPDSTLTHISRLYTSSPSGVRSQPPYCNMVIALQTTLYPERLLLHCQAIEKKLKRLRKRRWGARTIDIDILLYGNRQIHTQNLTVPHPELCRRDFVLIPLLEIAPNITLPGGEPLAPYLLTCKRYVIPNIIRYTHCR